MRIIKILKEARIEYKFSAKLPLCLKNYAKYFFVNKFDIQAQISHYEIHPVIAVLLVKLEKNFSGEIGLETLNSFHCIHN